MGKWLFREWALSLRATASYVTVAVDYMNIIYFEFDWTTHIGDNIYPHIFLDVKLFLRTYMERNVRLCESIGKKTTSSHASFNIDVFDVSRRPDALKSQTKN